MGALLLETGTKNNERLFVRSYSCISGNSEQSLTGKRWQSFPRKRESRSRLKATIWTPVYAGVTHMFFGSPLKSFLCRQESKTNPSVDFLTP
jgi:hypothetical protein